MLNEDLLQPSIYKNVLYLNVYIYLKMLVGWSSEVENDENQPQDLQDEDFWGWGGVFPLGINKIFIIKIF